MGGSPIRGAREEVSTRKVVGLWAREGPSRTIVGPTGTNFLRMSRVSFSVIREVFLASAPHPTSY